MSSRTFCSKCGEATSDDYNENWCQCGITYKKERCQNCDTKQLIAKVSYVDGDDALILQCINCGFEHQTKTGQLIVEKTDVQI